MLMLMQCKKYEIFRTNRHKTHRGRRGGTPFAIVDTNPAAGNGNTGGNQAAWS